MKFGQIYLTASGLAVTFIFQSDVRGSVHHSIIHKENPKRCNNVSKFYYSIFI